MSDLKNSKPKNQQIKMHTYRVTADIHTLKISKQSTFQSKILWKRHNLKAETKLVDHVHGFSTYNQSLTLHFDINYNTDQAKYESKNTELVAVIMIEDERKSGGYAKLDLAQTLNRSPATTEEDLVLALTGCPDPEAFIELTLTYELINEGMTDEMSMLNASSRDFNMSKLQFSDYKNEDLKDINGTIDRMKQLTLLIRSNKQQEGAVGPLYQKRLEILEGDNKQLKDAVKSYQDKLKEKEQMWKQGKADLEKQIANLEKVVDKKSKEIAEKNKQLSSMATLKEQDNEREREQGQFREKEQDKDGDYEENIRQLQRDSFEGNDKNPFETSNFGKGFSTIKEEERLECLEREKVGLESKLADMSLSIAMLFNAAVEIGGPELLDKLQSSMGLVEDR